MWMTREQSVHLMLEGEDFLDTTFRTQKPNHIFCILYLYLHLVHQRARIPPIAFLIRLKIGSPL